ncbi:hypothetical protein Vretimale_18803, partial [Volvox reticuliferus]
LKRFKMMTTKRPYLVSTSISSKRLANFARCASTTHLRTQQSCRANHGCPEECNKYTSGSLVQKLYLLVDQPTRGTPHANHNTRRSTVFALVAGLLASQSLPALADDDVKLPKEYRQLVTRLSEGLSESIEAEASGASEAEVRRKADPAKDTVREFVRKWRDNPRVSADITHAELKEALSELGEFYMTYGQRTKLTPPVRESVLKHLLAAKEALPAEPERKGSGLLGLF